MSKRSGEDNDESSIGPATLVPKNKRSREGNKHSGLLYRKGLRR